MHAVKQAAGCLSGAPQRAPGEDTDRAAAAERFDLLPVLSSLDETAYVWELETDRISWGANAAGVIGVKDLGDIATGAKYDLLVAPEHVHLRQAAIRGGMVKASGNGVPFFTQYRLFAGGPRSEPGAWIEEHGRWWPDGSGAPRLVKGVIRVVSDSELEARRHLGRNDHDELTGQLSRMRLTDALDAVISRATRTHAPAAFMMLSINNLTVINETFGFHIGDEVIAAVARAIREKLRGGDTIGRYSATKFGIILNDCGSGAMRIAAERFMRAVRDLAIHACNMQISATVSIGGVVIPAQASSVHDAVGHALQAHEQAKLRRHDCFIAYEPNEARESLRLRNVAIAEDVVSALNADRMRLVLQPMVSTRTGQPAIYECLLRMELPDGRIVSAGEFIPVAEQLGLARLIDRRTLELAVALLVKHPSLNLSVNVSSLTANDPEWTETLLALTRGRPGLTGRLVVEITETAAIEDLDQTKAFVDMLRELGCRVAIDDFGAGYTSFKNLKALKVDIVKIDGAFVKDIVTDQSDRAFIKTMVDLARIFDLETVAEWVGDEETARILTEAGITYLQGFHYGAPMTPKEIDATLNS